MGKIIILVLLYSINGFAGFEKSVGFVARSYPIQMSFIGEFAYRHYLWGDESKLLNGFLRPVVRVTTIGLAHSGRFELEVAPINILVFSVGGAFLQNNSNLTYVNCENYACQGNWWRQFWAVEAMMGAPVFAVTSKYSQMFVTYGGVSTLWIDPQANLIFRGRTGEVKSLENRFVIRNIENWIYGLISDVSWKGDASSVAHDSQYLFARYSPEPYSFVFGVGRYNAGDYLPGVSAFTYVKYSF